MFCVKKKSLVRHGWSPLEVANSSWSRQCSHCLRPLQARLHFRCVWSSSWNADKPGRGTGAVFRLLWGLTWFILVYKTLPSQSGRWLSQPFETYESQLGLLFPIYGRMKKIPNHQPAIIALPKCSTIYCRCIYLHLADFWGKCWYIVQDCPLSAWLNRSVWIVIMMFLLLALFLTSATWRFHKIGVPPVPIHILAGLFMETPTFWAWNQDRFHLWPHAQRCRFGSWNPGRLLDPRPALHVMSLIWPCDKAKEEKPPLIGDGLYYINIIYIYTYHCRIDHPFLAK